MSSTPGVPPVESPNGEPPKHRYEQWTLTVPMETAEAFRAALVALNQEREKSAQPPMPWGTFLERVVVAGYRTLMEALQRQRGGAPAPAVPARPLIVTPDEFRRGL